MGFGCQLMSLHTHFSQISRIDQKKIILFYSYVFAVIQSLSNIVKKKFLKSATAVPTNSQNSIEKSQQPNQTSHFYLQVNSLWLLGTLHPAHVVNLLTRRDKFHIQRQHSLRLIYMTKKKLTLLYVRAVLAYWFSRDAEKIEGNERFKRSRTVAAICR